MPCSALRSMLKVRPSQATPIQFARPKLLQVTWLCLDTRARPCQLSPLRPFPPMSTMTIASQMPMGSRMPRYGFASPRSDIQPAEEEPCRTCKKILAMQYNTGIKHNHANGQALLDCVITIAIAIMHHNIPRISIHPPAQTPPINSPRQAYTQPTPWPFLRQSSQHPPVTTPNQTPPFSIALCLYLTGCQND